MMAFDPIAGSSREAEGAGVEVPRERELRERLDGLRTRLQDCEWNDVDLLVRAAGLCVELGKREEAVNMLERAVNLDRSNAYACARLQEVATEKELGEMELPGAVQNLSRNPSDPFLYPFRGAGPYALVGGGIFYSGVYWLMFLTITRAGLPFAMLAATICSFFVGYLVLFLGRVVSSSAIGRSDMPDWPNFDPGSVVLAIQLLMVYLASGAPALAILGIGLATELVHPGIVVVISFALLAAGACVFPMMVLVFFIQKSLFRALNPARLLRGICAGGRQYWVAVAIWAVLPPAWTIMTLGAMLVPFIGQILAAGVLIYFLTVGCRAIGLVYQARQEQLGWY